MPINDEKLKSGQGFTVTPKSKQPQPEMPSIGKVVAQHAIARTQSSVAEMRRVGEARTAVVLQAFDESMTQSDRDIMAGLESRLGGNAESFFGDCLIGDMQALLTPSIAVAALPVGVEVV